MKYSSIAGRTVFSNREDADKDVRECIPYIDMTLHLNGVVKIEGQPNQDITLYFSKGMVVDAVLPMLDRGEEFDSNHLVEKL